VGVGFGIALLKLAAKTPLTRKKSQLIFFASAGEEGRTSALSDSHLPTR